MERTSALRDERRRRLLGVARVWALAVAMLVTAVGLYLVALADDGGVTDAPFHLPWWSLAPLFFATETLVVRVRYRGQGQALNLNEVPLVIGLFFSSPAELLLALLLGSTAALARKRRQSPLQLAVNTSHFFLAGVLASMAFRQVTASGLSGDEIIGPSGWSAAILAAILVTVVGHAAITAATVLSGSQPDVDRLRQVLSLGATTAITTTMVSLIAVVMLWRDQRSVVLLVVPVAMSALAYKAYTEHRAKSDTLDLIYESTRMLHRSPEVDSALVGLLSQARTIFRAERAEITLMPVGDVTQVVRTTLGPGAAVDAMVRVELSPEEREWAESLPSDEPCFYPDAGRPLSRVLTERGVHEAMAVAVRRDGVVVATIVVANRIGEANHFDSTDLELFRALTSNVAVVLENGTFEQSLQQLRDLEAQLKHQAYHDPLTGLANRSQFIERVELALEFAASDTRRLAVLFLDLDDFKLLNDVLGHATGDELLKAVASRIAAAVGPEDAVARLSGDEFAVLLDGHTGADAVAVARRVLDAVRIPVTLGGERHSLRATIGVAMGDSATRADELIRNADVAMDTGKQAGKNQVQVFSADMHVAVIERHELMADLQRAVERDEFVLHYQPIVSLQTQRVVAFEVLVRWNHPRRGLVSPADFIPLAEETDLILPIGRLVLAKACAQAKAWQETYPEHADLALTVNLSARQLQQPSFVGDTVQLIAESGVSPENLVLEITESVLMEDTGGSIAKLLQLKRLGLRLAMDDFGTGYSSLSFLAELPIDILKVAKPFTEGLGRTERETAFAEAIVGLGKTVGMQVIAEGVERPEQGEMLRAMGCDMGQGYHYSKPRDASYVEHLLRLGSAPEDRKIIPFPA
ncbi:MAG TPA: EAL domain-containing protein [Acidimicrobiales bacterium]|nr:EAL domain-containing protein [Acidimicrobiales bacterium]